MTVKRNQRLTGIFFFLLHQKLKKDRKLSLVVLKETNFRLKNGQQQNHKLR